MARIARDDIDHWFDFGVSVPSNTLYMGSAEYDAEGERENGVDFLMAERTIKGLHLLDQKKDKPITIIMNNPGGDVYHGAAIYDAIKGCKNHITIKVYGHAMSMGSIILQAADERIMAPNSKFMIHYGTWGINGSHTKTFQKWAEECKRYDKWMIDMYLERIREKHPKYSRKKVDEMCNFDTILTAKETVDLGFADKVLT